MGLVLADALLIVSMLDKCTTTLASYNREMARAFGIRGVQFSRFPFLHREFHRGRRQQIARSDRTSYPRCSSRMSIQWDHATLLIVDQVAFEGLIPFVTFSTH